jgi:hypothetical protein
LERKLERDGKKNTIKSNKNDIVFEEEKMSSQKMTESLRLEDRLIPVPRSNN